MTNVIAEFSRGADKIWKLLNAQGPISETTLMNMTMLNEQMFYGAIGWLARENKVNRNGHVYKLGPTNLTDKIGTDAGKIWGLLTTLKEADMNAIAKLSQVNDADAYSALGWLACEQKIDAKSMIVLK
ncbi:MAG: winged helix-turn-helix domain-containing protein [Euryarchaeota archaeon]|nr:winged helix-turn-helix domain-containing protein [Euryarchaeota archaeon]